ncbi:MAG: UDP-glucose--hexose-1-phosphate uridylyltransferase [Spirochaetia bacterium]
MNLQEMPHRRYNILTGEWILVSPHRTKRPWQGQQEEADMKKRPKYDKSCYLCPGNSRSGGYKNPDYEDTFVFVNDFSALLEDTPDLSFQESGLLKAEGESGICKVICFTPRHDLSFPKMDVQDIKKVVDVWAKEYKAIGSRNDISYVQIFENHGAAMGCSNPHPHCQIWANSTVPVLPSTEWKRQKEYFNTHGSVMLLDYLDIELKDKSRIVFENNSFVALVPFWAVWPYETMLLPKEHLKSLADFNEKHKQDYADAIKRMGVRFDNLFKTDFPYSMGLHQQPTDGEEYNEWLFHVHYFPPLLRSATVKKFMVGYEMMATAQRDITAETSAENLRNCSEVHYTEQN